MTYGFICPKCTTKANGEREDTTLEDVKEN